MTIAELLRRVGRAVIETGCLWVHIPPLPEPATAGPPRRHPERLRPDIPLNAVERDLLRRLRAETAPVSERLGLGSEP